MRKWGREEAVHQLALQSMDPLPTFTWQTINHQHSEKQLNSLVSSIYQCWVNGREREVSHKHSKDLLNRERREFEADRDLFVHGTPEPGREQDPQLVEHAYRDHQQQPIEAGRDDTHHVEQRTENDDVLAIP